MKQGAPVLAAVLRSRVLWPFVSLPSPLRSAEKLCLQVDGLQLALRQEQKAGEEQGPPGKAMKAATYRSAFKFSA